MGGPDTASDHRVSALSADMGCQEKVRHWQEKMAMLKMVGAAGMSLRTPFQSNLTDLLFGGRFAAFDETGQGRVVGSKAVGKLLFNFDAALFLGDVAAGDKLVDDAVHRLT